MRSITLLLSILLLLVPAVSAEINFNTINQEIYNYGDSIVFSGDVTQANDLRGIFSLILECPEGTVSLSTKILDLTGGAAQSFSESTVLPEGQTGRCVVRGRLTDLETSFIEDAVSDEFVITNDIRADFDPIENTYQLGDALIIYGKLLRYNNQGLEGSATISFNKLGETVNMHVAEVRSGELNFQKDLSFIPPGDYTIDIFIKDNGGNERLFPGLFAFTLEGNVEVSLEQEKSLYLPGETAFISGTIRSKTGVELKDTTITLSLEEEQHTQTLSSSSSPFTFTLPLSSSIKTGSHEFLITAKDGKGNIGEIASSFEIEAVATSLFLNLDKLSFIPQEAVSFEAKLLDQADDPMETPLTVELIDPKGVPQALKLVDSNVAEAIDVPARAEPGSWQLKARAADLEDERIIKVLEHSSLEIDVQGDELVVKNDGNVKFKDYLSVLSSGAEKKKRLNLGIGDETRLKLNKLFDPGVHTLEVPMTGDVFEDVNIPEGDSLLNALTGAAILDFSNPKTKSFLFILVFLVVIVIFFLYLKKSKRRSIYTKEIVDKEFRERPPKPAAKEEVKEVKKTRPQRQYGVADEKDIEDFRNRMKNMFNEEEKKKQRRRTEIYGSRQDSPSSSDSKPADGAPNIFDIFK